MIARVPRGVEHVLRTLVVLSAVGGVAATLGGVTASPAAASFGVEVFENDIATQGGAPATQAGSHPYAMTTTIVFDHHEPTELQKEEQYTVVPDGDPKDVEVRLPPGVIVNPQATETKCAESELELTGKCPAAAAVGVVKIDVGYLGGETISPVYNMAPPPGAPAEFGFNVGQLKLIVHVVGEVRTGSDYGVSADVPGLLQKVGLYGIALTLWGDPSAESHDGERGECAESGGSCPVDRVDRPLLTLPSSCTGGPLEAAIMADSWQELEMVPGPTAESAPLSGCDELDFSPKLTVRPTEPEAAAAESPTGVDVDLKIPQEESLEGLAEADLREAVVTLPPGMTVSPSGANGLEACSEAEVGLADAQAPTCPDSSKIGSVKLVTPLFEQPLEGALYVAQQEANPFKSLLALYLVAEGDGTLIKLPGEIELDEAPGASAGQVTVRLGEDPVTGFFLPQLPFSEVDMRFFGGPRALLATPPACGAYTTTSKLTPYSSPTPAEPRDTLTVASRCGGGGFAPTFAAGTTDNQAGAFSSFTATFSRNDGEQDLGAITVKPPPGLLGMLANVALCGEPQASLGACGAGSEIGEATVAAGPGAQPYYIAGGRVYLTGPYGGAPFGLAIVVPALAGPFDLGTVTVRGSIEVSPRTGALTVAIGSLPTMLRGIPLDIRTVDLDIDREGFAFNPTNCEALAVSATIGSAQGASASPSSRFQAANCAALPFEPSVSASTQGRASFNRDGASLTVKVTQRTGEAAIRSLRLALPRRLPARLSTLQKACAEAMFDANPARCPATSDVGIGVVHTPILPVPLEGPAYFVSHGGARYPELVFVLQGEGVAIDLAGETSVDSKTRVTSSTFGTVPDAPISSFEARLPEQPDSALASLTARGLCGSKGLSMPTAITGQNGVQIAQSTKVAIVDCPKRHKKAGSIRR